MKLKDKYADLIPADEFPRLFELFGDLSVLEHPIETDKKDDLGKDILIVESAPIKNVIGALTTKQARQIIQTSASLFRLEIILSGLMNLEHEVFCNNPAAFMMRFFRLQFSGEVTEHEFTLTETTEKWAVLEALKGLLPSTTSESQVTEIRSVIDELVTNAFFNAPVDRNKKPLFKVRNRSDDFTLPEGQKIKIKIGVAKSHMLVLVQDPYGSVVVRDILKRLHDIYSHDEPPTPRIGTGGAGLGLKMVLDRIESFYMVVKPDAYSLFGTLIPTDKGMKKMFSTSKNIHLNY
ncbi:ATP-binding protein [Bdellovibrio svalbardensis]|uniref:ATP-binding protein n=1 Tax=Bdellovibrio svalbardensis TaxID=2972972 RepID=A0ABT6DGQ3_9BACT|nr:ATP-binding protein [Bdellovibrio svalbardensis]MDG0815435.1 ATP-binding protein [Bdellovibrio svalbardensis]